MKSFGPLYVGKLEYYHRHFLPIIEKGWTQETDDKFRVGHCLVFRLPFTHPGFYIGWFYSEVEDPYSLTEDEIDQIIAKAMMGRDMGLDTEEIGDWNV